MALEEDVVDALGPRWGLHEADRVVACVAVQESEANLAARPLDIGKVGDAEAKEVAVEADALVEAAGVDEDVAEAHVPGLEAAHGAGRVEGLLVDRVAPEHLGGDAVGVDALDQVDDAAVV